MIKKLINKLRPGRSTALTVAGLGWLAAAAWQLHDTAGVAAVGASFLITAWILEED